MSDCAHRVSYVNRHGIEWEKWYAAGAAIAFRGRRSQVVFPVDTTISGEEVLAPPPMGASARFCNSEFNDFILRSSEHVFMVWHTCIVMNGGRVRH